MKKYIVIFGENETAIIKERSLSLAKQLANKKFKNVLSVTLESK